jgi:hypothetical protein
MISPMWPANGAKSRPARIHIKPHIRTSNSRRPVKASIRLAFPLVFSYNRHAKM